MSGDLVFIGDVHLSRDDSALGAFLALLDRLRLSARRIVLMGDLFDLWIGRPELEGPHHRAVCGSLRELRRAGVFVRYVEGNRDYHLAPAYLGSAVDEASDAGFVERVGELSLFAIHGDLANARDRRYRAWRRISRSRPLFALFNALPAATRGLLAERLERRLRQTNLQYKREFPEAEVRQYAARFLRDGHRAVVLGHFHVEKDLEAEPPSPAGRILVLPEWKGSRRVLRVTAGGQIGFVGG